MFQILSASSTTDSQVYALESSNPSMSTSVSDGWQRGNVQSDCELMDDDPALDDIFNGIDVNSATQRYVLAEKFDVTHFRDFQKQAVEAALKGKDYPAHWEREKLVLPVSSCVHRENNFSYNTYY